MYLFCKYIFDSEDKSKLSFVDGEPKKTNK